MISLVVCTYNRDRFIGTTLDRIASCTVPEEGFEIVLVDNNSSDSTASVCASIAAAHPEVRYRYFLETSQGLSYARNRGIAEAEGDIIVFLDDDSFVEPDYLVRLSVRMADYPDAAAFGGRIDPLFESGKAPEWLCKWTLSWVSAIDNGDVVSLFKGGKYPIGANMGFRSSVLKAMPGFDTSLGRTGKNLLGGEEKEIFGRISSSGGLIYYFPDVRVQHVIPERRTTRDYIIRFARGIGYSEYVRCSRKGGSALLKRRFSELVKWGATLVLWPLYLLRGRPACGNALVLFRANVSRGLFRPDSLEI
ncbi:MAG: glycosyltransferase family 2 protein [Bacteroidales bacterium]|nr:glycosyltransferase family 2 protein [Bacteroidales bacterium]